MGCENPAQNELVQAKKKATMLDRYGVVSPIQSEGIKNKIQNTNLLKYGHKNPGQTEYAKQQHTKLYQDNNRVAEITQQIKETNLEKYGVDTPLKNCVINNKRKKTNLEKYGVEEPIGSVLVRKKSQQTMLKKFGVEFASQVPELVSKMKTTRKQNNFLKFNREHESQLHISLDNLEILNDKIKFSEMLKKYGRVEMANILGVGVNIISTRHKKFGLDIIQQFSSSHESEIASWLSDLNIVVKKKDRVICKPNELDVVLPDFKLAIEFDGIYWHSEQGSGGKCNSSYHISKTKKCEDQRIQLIHIFEDEWLNKKDICKSIIMAQLGLTTNKIAARKCQIVELTNKQIKHFVDENHLQGHVTGKINLGLYFNKDLVAAMTFGKPRYNKNIQWELLRLVIKKDTQILGGVEKLWAYFQKTYKPETIVSYCDKRWFSGNVYNKLGFVLHTKGKPTYWYTDYKQRFHRSRFQKHKLVDAGYDKTLTEAVITRDILGLDRIWDCGQDSWIWKKIL